MDQDTHYDPDLYLNPQLCLFVFLGENYAYL